MQKSIHSFNHAIEKSHTWLKELTKMGHFKNEEEAYSALHAVLPVLRDRLLVDEAVQFAAQLPIIIRGIYFDGWKPHTVPNKERNPEEFIEKIAHNLHNAIAHIEPANAARQVFHFLEHKISSGEMGDIKGELPQAILEILKTNGEKK